ncbi:MAG: hypothetical protein QOE70_6634 [Chthoniobacter sp.]|jgi:hypothetical protein|nr:hypothetical protein [Chthoniobacter sp.]
MKQKRAFLLLLLSLTVFPSDAAEPRRYRLTLNFSEPAFRWSRTITYRDEFHLILDDAPLGDGYWGFVAGVIYPKNGQLYTSLKMSKLRGKSETDAAVLGLIAHARLPSDLRISIPIVTKDFKSCTATFTPIK